MVYVCERCAFLFERMGEVETCPVCGAPCLREANAAEQAAFLTQKEENRTPKE